MAKSKILSIFAVMKRLLFIGIVLSCQLCLWVACASNGDDIETCRSTSQPATASPELSAIDSLLWQQPDSALAVLQDYLDCRDVACNISDAYDTTMEDIARYVSTTPYERHYANLLLAELLYKNYCPQTNRSELKQAVVYFDSLCCRDVSENVSTNAFLGARAHYINGVGYYEHDSVVDACKEYLKALEMMEDHYEEKEIVGKKAKVMALTHSHLTSLFSDLYLHEQAIFFGEMAVHYYNKYKASPLHIAWALDVIGLHFDILQNYDSASYYYEKGISILSDTNNSVYRDIATHLAFFSYKKGIIANSTNHLHIIKAQAESGHEYASRCLTIGEIFYHERQYDSAWHYLNIVYNKSFNIGSKKQAAEWLAEIADIQGKGAEALEYASFLVPFANVEENQSGIKSQLTALYSEYRQTCLDYQHQKKMQKRIILWLFVFGVLFLVIVFLFFRSIKHKKTLETERYDHKIQQAALAGRLKRSNADLKEQKKKQTASFPPSTHQFQSNTENYLEEPICKYILSVCNDKNNPIKSTVPISAYANIALSDAQKAQLKDAAMQHYTQLFKTLKHQHPELKEKDFFYCYLSLLGLDNVQIAVLQQNSISTIWERERRLKKIFESENKVSVILFGFVNN